MTSFKHGYSLLIGVGGDLPNTISDATGLYDILTNPARCAYPPSQVSLLTGDTASKGNILGALEKIAKQIEQDKAATVVIYFSGHGGFSPEYHLVPHGYDGTPDTMISGSFFSKKISSLKAKKVLILLDSCHAAGMINIKNFMKSPIPPELDTILGKGSGRVAIASSMKDEVSYAGEPYSIFTQALRESLAGAGSSEKDGVSRVADIAMYLSKVIPQRTKGRQNPVLKIKEADNFAVAFYSGGSKNIVPLTDEYSEASDLDEAALREELDLHKQNLRELRKQSIKFGSLHVPIYLIHAIDDEEKEIRRITGMLNHSDT